jgi:hypothetical protein
MGLHDDHGIGPGGGRRTLDRPRAGVGSMLGREVHRHGNMADIGLDDRGDQDALLQVFEGQVTAPRFPPDLDARHEAVSPS